MSEYLTHQTLEGDRWDLLAYRYYGNATSMALLLRANTAVASLSILPGGLTLKIPILEAADVTANVISGSLPWL